MSTDTSSCYRNDSWDVDPHASIHEMARVRPLTRLARARPLTRLMRFHSKSKILIACLCYHHLVILCSPNEDFGRMNKRWHPDFRPTFQWSIAQIEYSRPWKVLHSKSGFHLLLHLPKSSFGMDKWFRQTLSELTPGWDTSSCYRQDSWDVDPHAL